MSDTTTEKLNDDDPCDGISSETLTGWIYYDSDRMRKEDLGQRLERRDRDRYPNSWIRFDNG